MEKALESGIAIQGIAIVPRASGNYKILLARDLKSTLNR